MTCTGFNHAPERIFKSPSRTRLPSGTYKKFNGLGTCRQCGGLYSLRERNGEAVVMSHKPLSECRYVTQCHHAKQIRRMTWREPVFSDRTTTYAGEVNMHINIIEQNNGFYQTTHGSTQYFSNSTQPFRMEIVSNTTASGSILTAPFNGLNYIYSFNGINYVYPMGAITVATDYATWNTWNQTIHLSHQSQILITQTWENWVQVGIQGNAILPAHYTPPRVSEEEREAQRIRDAEALFQRVEAQNAAKAEAKSRAEETLLSLLTPEQRVEYRARRHFHIRGSRGTLFRIMHGSSGNVREVRSPDDERGIHAYCAHPAMSVRDEAGRILGQLPHEDAMIHQMLALMADEDAFLAIANRHW